MTEQNYLGQLTIANPNNGIEPNGIHKSVNIIVTHADDLIAAVQLNNVYPDLTLSKISYNMGIDHMGDFPIYRGGGHRQNKIHIIHSLDWTSVSTVPLTDEIGITGDLSVLVAISRNVGPELFRACAGYHLWDHYQYQKELAGEGERRWELLPATLERVFHWDPRHQYKLALEEIAKLSVEKWFA